jgi:hypothetical protein
MRVFTCGHCHQAVYFENIVCENCGMALGFDPDSMTMRTVGPADGGPGTTSDRSKIYCANYANNVCNWLVPNTPEGGLCIACGLNRTIPDLTIAGNAERWFDIEKAKRRLIYTLLKLKLPVTPPPGSDVPTLAFDIIADAKTGHADGLITINLAEADPAKREETREAFNEPYRTLLGHFRHESGHYYWMLLANNPRWLERYRTLFGDEANYAEALATYHQHGPKVDWRKNYISAYATAHSWEDWAESWAHYLHMVDTLETATDYGIDPRLPHARQTSWAWLASPDPYRAKSAKHLMDRWVPLALAMNSMNRSMGHHDFYPFVVSPSVISKLDFIHQLVQSKAARQAGSRWFANATHLGF